jgi:hypothetical protein
MCSTSWKRTFLEGSFLSSISLALNETSQNKRVQRQGAAAGWPGKSHGACLGSHLPGVAGASRWPAASAPTAARGEATAGVIDLLRSNPDLANVRHSRRRAISRPKALCLLNARVALCSLCVRPKARRVAGGRSSRTGPGVLVLERRAAVDQWRGYLEAEREPSNGLIATSCCWRWPRPSSPPPRSAHAHHMGMGWWAKMLDSRSTMTHFSAGWMHLRERCFCCWGWSGLTRSLGTIIIIFVAVLARVLCETLIKGEVKCKC